MTKCIRRRENSLEASIRTELGFMHVLSSFLGLRGLLDKYGEFNPLNTKRRPLYLKTQFVPRSKHFSSRL